jgi:hypothetical protein
MMVGVEEEEEEEPPSLPRIHLYTRVTNGTKEGILTGNNGYMRAPNGKCNEGT